MKKYNVIWFDDDFSELNLIRENASLNGILLFGFTNAKEGIEELDRNLKFYDAAIVDGRFYTDPDQEGDSYGDSALFNVGLAIERLSSRKKISWFILSGHASFTKEKNKLAKEFKNDKVYDKTNDAHLSALWQDLKSEAS